MPPCAHLVSQQARLGGISLARGLHGLVQRVPLGGLQCLLALALRLYRPTHLSTGHVHVAVCR